MATIGNTYYNLADYFRSLSPDGSIEADIVEILAELTPLVLDAVALECNNGTEHIHMIRDSLPTVTWGRLYKGIPASKSGRSQVKDTTGFVEGLSPIDMRLLELAGDKANAVRLSEARGFLEAMAQEAEETAFYGDTLTTPEEFKGLAARYNSLSSSQVVDGGGSGSDNTSIFFVTWAEDLTALLHPKNTKAGISREDMGRQRTTDALGNAYYILEELFRWHLGMAIKDPRVNVRIANIDVSEMQAGNVNLYALMRKAYYKMHTRRMGKYMKPDGMPVENAARTGRSVIYMNKDVLEVLDTLATNGGADDNFVRLRPMELEGKEVLSYRQMPIRETDSIINGEQRVV